MTVWRCSCGCGTVVRAGSRFAPGHNNPKRWTAERIVAAMQQWTDEHGSAPMSETWQRGGVSRDRFPTASTVAKVFGSWQKALAEAGVLPIREQRWRTLDPAFGHWLAGVIDGEGSFTIRRGNSGGYFSPRFGIKMRVDDAAILNEIQLRAGLGSVYRPAPRRGNPSCRWDVHSQVDAQELIEILNEYPLRSRKAADYAIWKQAVALSSAMPRGNRWCRSDWGPMVALKQQLEAVRKYRPPGPLATDATQRAELRRDVRADEPWPCARSQGKPGRWTGELIVAAIERWTAEHGFPPTYEEWSRVGTRSRECPSSTTVKRVFGSWHGALADAGVLPVREQRWRTLDPAFGHWLAGLADGEGTFGIHRAGLGTYFSPRFAIKLRNDDTAILQEIQLRLGLGSIYREVGSRLCRWQVHSRGDVEELVKILDRYPLRAKKARDYLIWRRAVEVWTTMPRGNRERRQRGWCAIAELKQDLESVRKYRPTALP
jgi:LAGLIDADG endonuclease/Homing endonuclease associated repeat